MKHLLIGFVAMISTTVSVAIAADIPMPQPIQFEEETLDNGLKVIYAPMTNAPAIHVRVLYHVGSRDEAANRQGFAHMFEHMMFRGSAHVPSEQHMKLIQGVGGVSNAFTSFDQTTYVNTIPSNHLEMALWLEADRMASFKVSEDVFKTERNVVKEEWRLRYANQPYGKMTQDLLALAFKTHNYRWTPIGDMDQLAAAKTEELQAFHDRYYVPNNACLIIAGQYDVSQAREWVRKYYGWIPKGADVQRVSQPEPQQTEVREKIVKRPDVPFTRVSIAYKSPDYRNDDNLALELLTTILGDGRSSRLYQALVANDPVAANVSMGSYQLEDPSVIMVGLGVLPGKDSAEAIGRVEEQIAKVIAEGVSAEELEKAKSQTRNALVRTRMTAESVATILGEEEVFGGDANRANTYFERLEKITADDVKTVAQKYLQAQGKTVVQYQRGEATPEQPVSIPPEAPVATSEPRKIEFPKDYPTTPPTSDEVLKASFAKGEMQTVHGVQVITMTDNRLPIVNVSLVLRGGGDAAPVEKEGVASLTAAMLSRGAGGQSAVQIAEELESRGISISASDDGDTTRINAFAPVDQLDFAVAKLKQIALQPDFPADEFAKLKRQSQQGLLSALSNPGSVADRAIDAAVYGEKHPLGKQMTLESLDAVSIEDVKNWYGQTYRPENAILVIAGAVDTKKGTELAGQMLEGWKDGLPPQAKYDVPSPGKRQIILVDNPTGEQAVVRLGLQAYSLQSEDRFPGSIAGQVLSSGIDSRLNRVLRAEKGLTYGAYGYFRPSRHGGAFEMSIETKLESVNDAITSAYGVLEKMKSGNITDAELSESKNRVAGQLVLETQTIQQQAGRRVDTILNGFPVDYYDNYAQRIAEVTADQVRAVMNKYVSDEKFNIVVVAPAEKVKAQLESLGEVTVVDMPLKDLPSAAMAGRPRTTTRPAQ